MKTWTEKLSGIIALIESGDGIHKKKAKEELEKMAILADKLILLNKKLKDLKDWEIADRISHKNL